MQGLGAAAAEVTKTMPTKNEASSPNRSSLSMLTPSPMLTLRVTRSTCGALARFRSAYEALSEGQDALDTRRERDALGVLSGGIGRLHSIAQHRGRPTSLPASERKYGTKMPAFTRSRDSRARARDPRARPRPGAAPRPIPAL